MSSDTRTSTSLIGIFHEKLHNEWKAKAFCGREYFRPIDIEKWMLRKDTDMSISNAGCLLSEVYKNHPIPPLKSADIVVGDHRCLIVLAILLDLGCGHLLHVFQRHNINDHALSTRYDAFTLALLLTDDLKREGVQDAKELLVNFTERKWLYCPGRLEFGMQNAFLDPGCGRWIMPFCKRQQINSKGGTAQLWEVVVHESDVPHSLARVIGRSKHEDSEHGTCYAFALKRFTQESSDVFDLEKAAYTALRGKAGMIQYLGEYSIDERLENETIQRTSNILLEYGESDLEEFFESKPYPPNLEAERVRFWESIANVAEALEKVHNLNISLEDGNILRLDGWHADIKPANILKVDEEFKLADFGFAKFKPRNRDRVPTELMTGGTRTYGAPECDRNRRGRGTLTGVTQAIDTWSFGCVLSVSATWVVLGHKGVLAFEKLRQEAITSLRNRGNCERASGPTADDAFHDGVRVLQEVTDWHDFLRGVMRKSDTITELILDLVDKNMLLSKPERRLNSKDLYIELRNQLGRAEIQYKSLVDNGRIKSVAKSVEDALLGFEKWSMVDSQYEPTDSNGTQRRLLSKRRSGRSLTMPQRHQVKSSRSNKPERVRQVVESTAANRDDALTESEQELNEGAAAYTHRRSVDKGQHTIPTHTQGKTSIPRITNYPIDEDPQPNSTPYDASSPTHFPGYSRPPIVPVEFVEKEAVILDPLVSTAVHQGRDTSAYSVTQQSLIESPQNAETPTEVQSPARNQVHAQLWGPQTDILESPIAISPNLSQSYHFQPTANHQTEPDPTWPICIEHNGQKNSDKKIMRALFFGKEQDQFLKNFLINRDIKFLIDNDSSMSSFWKIMTIVLDTLVSKIDRLDKNGLDIEFTIGNEHNADSVSGKQVMSKFKDAKEDALTRLHPFETDMEKTLTHIFDQYLSNPVRRMTLIVLTDGVWRGTLSSEVVEKAIADFLKKKALNEKLEKRWFTIQFISFGDAGLQILERLDDEMEKTYSIPDVIDTEPVSGDVYKMILGSVYDKFDKKPTSPSLSPLNPVPPRLSIPQTTSSLERQNSFKPHKRLSRLNSLFK
ncbi:hypothetical protein F5B20DRAFT_52386 [Whalleya microplaca]|nr:hypothetical protein F5B20DRAFT_52386 [Whalleya microplaca]